MTIFLRSNLERVSFTHKNTKFPWFLSAVKLLFFSQHTALNEKNNSMWVFLRKHYCHDCSRKRPLPFVQIMSEGQKNKKGVLVLHFGHWQIIKKTTKFQNVFELLKNRLKIIIMNFITCHYWKLRRLFIVSGCFEEYFTKQKKIKY